MVSKEEALAELQRRGITPDMAKAELERRGALPKAQPPLEPHGRADANFIERVGEQFGQRLKNMREIEKLSQQKGAPAAAIIPMAGEALSVPFDVIGEGLGTLSKTIAPEMTQSVQQAIGSLLQSAPAQNIAQGYHQFSEEMPLLAENIEGALGIVTTALPFLRSGTIAERSAVPKMVKNSTQRANAVVPSIASTDRGMKKILSRSELEPQQILGRLQEGDILNITDVAGDEVTGLVRSLGKLEGAKNTIFDALTQRSDDAVKRVTSQLSKSVSNIDQYFGNLDEVAKSRAKMAKPLYEKSYREAPDIQDPRLAKFMADQRIQNAIVKAKTEYGVRLEATQNSLETLDGVKKVLYDLESEAVKSPNLASSYRQLRQGLVEVLDDASPSYRKARKVYETSSQLLDAQEAGRMFDRLQPEQLKIQMKNLQPHELDAYKIGVRQKLQEIASKTPEGADPAKRIFGNTQKKDQLKAVLGKNYDEFAKKMTEEIDAAKTKQAILGGSRTDINIYQDSEFVGEAASAARRGFIQAAVNKVVDEIVGSLQRAYVGISPKNAKELAEIFVNREKGIKALQDLIEKQSNIEQKAILKKIAQEQSQKVMLQNYNFIKDATAQDVKKNAIPYSILGARALGSQQETQQ